MILQFKDNELSVEQMKEELKFWQTILRLEDWDIDIRKVHLKDLGDDRVAESRRVVHTKQAVIFYISHEDIKSGVNPARMVHGGIDDEVTLVHELLHIVFLVDPYKFSDFLDGSNEDMANFVRDNYEQSIELTAQALVYLRRAAESAFVAV